MNFKQVISTVYSLCIDLQAQGKFIEPEIDLKRKEIDLWFNDGFAERLPFSTQNMSHWEYSENPTEQDLKDGDKQGNFYSCIQFLESLLNKKQVDPASNGYRLRVDLNEMYHDYTDNL